MFEELVAVMEKGAVLRIGKGTVSLRIPVEKVEVITYTDFVGKEIIVTLSGGSIVNIYDDYNITRACKPNDVMDKYKWCYRIIDEEDAVFYIADK